MVNGWSGCLDWHSCDIRNGRSVPVSRVPPRHASLKFRDRVKDMAFFVGERWYGLVLIRAVNYVCLFVSERLCLRQWRNMFNR
jgi:hypothetical protein